MKCPINPRFCNVKFIMPCENGTAVIYPLTLSLLARNVICCADQNSILEYFVYHTAINSDRSHNLNFEQVTTSDMPSESYFNKDFNGFNLIQIS